MAKCAKIVIRPQSAGVYSTRMDASETWPPFERQRGRSCNPRRIPVGRARRRLVRIHGGNRSRTYISIRAEFRKRYGHSRRSSEILRWPGLGQTQKTQEVAHRGRVDVVGRADLRRATPSALMDIESVSKRGAQDFSIRNRRSARRGRGGPNLLRGLQTSPSTKTDGPRVRSNGESAHRSKIRPILYHPPRGGNGRRPGAFREAARFGEGFPTRCIAIGWSEVRLASDRADLATRSGLWQNRYIDRGLHAEVHVPVDHSARPMSP